MSEHVIVRGRRLALEEVADLIQDGRISEDDIEIVDRGSSEDDYSENSTP
jgi:hypothetical protein